MRLFGPPCRRGMTLVELMVVVAIIAVLLTIALPSLIRARIVANEASCVASLRAIGTAEEQYRHIEGDGDYAGLLSLHQASPYYIDQVLGYGRKSGYSFVGTTNTTPWFTFHAHPLTLGKTGNRRFFIDASGVIRINVDGVATSGSMPLE